MCKILVVLRFGRQGLKAKRGGCKTQEVEKKREKGKREEKVLAKIWAITRRGWGVRIQSGWGGHTTEIYCWARSGFLEEDERQAAGP
jgi:hypothetical protein